MAKFLQRISQGRPRPFLYLQKSLQIEEEWDTLKTSLRPHRFKLFLVTLFATYPFYKPYVKSWFLSLNLRLQEELQPNKPGPLAFESFAKQRVENILRDPYTKTEGAIFLSHVVKKDAVLDAIVHILVNTAQDKIFLSKTTGLVKNLTHELLHDQEVEDEALELMKMLLQNNEVKHEGVQMIKWLSENESTKQEFISLWKKCFNDPKFQIASRDILANAFYELLTEKETVEKLKSFFFYLLENEERKGSMTKKNLQLQELIDLAVDKVTQSYKGENKENEFKRILKEEGKLDIFESIEKRKKSAQGDEKKEKKFFFF